MKKGPYKNIAASVHQRLLYKARESGRPFNELLQYFAMERFLYRLSKTCYADNFVLKGALMLTVWEAPLSRPTMDIALLGQIDNSIDTIVDVTKDICDQEVEPDGITFDPISIEGERITEVANYEGVRIKLRGSLGTAKITMRLDIGFGDVIIPAAVSLKYPTILDLPAPKLQGYSKESYIAEKFEAMVKLGILNSRMKDFFDIWLLLRQFNFKGPRLATAITKTFSKRGTVIPPEPVILMNSFTEDMVKAAQWHGFIRKFRLTDVPENFVEVTRAIATFLGPIAKNLSRDLPFKANWKAPGPWQE